MFIISQLGKGRNNSISWHAGHHRRSNAHPTLALGSTLCRDFFTNPFFGEEGLKLIDFAARPPPRPAEMIPGPNPAPSHQSPAEGQSLVRCPCVLA